jgi:hypothetical protein
MSTRTIRDYMSRAFFAKDKATFAEAVKDAEEELPPQLRNAKDDDDHDEPDGDEGEHAGHKGGIHIHVEHKNDGKPTADSIDARVAKLEDGLKSIDAKLTKITDSMVKLADADVPEEFKEQWKRKGADGDKDDEDEEKSDDAKAKDEGEKMPAELLARFKAKRNGNGDDEEEETGDAYSEKEEGDMSMVEKMQAAEPDLMEADPALKTGKSKMGDAAAIEQRIRKALVQVARQAVERGSVLAPGLKLPTVDTASEPLLRMHKRLCGYRREALTRALGSENGKKAVGSRYNKDRIAGMSCEAVQVLFTDASDRMYEINNAAMRAHNPDAFTPAEDFRSQRAKQQDTLAAWNAANREYWDKRRAH